jgi:hypothetical protein
VVGLHGSVVRAFIGPELGVSKVQFKDFGECGNEMAALLAANGKEVVRINISLV